MRLAALTLSFLLVGCAAQPERKMSFNLVFRAPDQLAPPQPLPAAAQAPEAVSSPELQSALIGFATRARKLRGEGHGRPMPDEQQDNWQAVLEQVDELLRQAARQTSSYDVIRARVVLEAELELDVRAYGAVPQDVAVNVELRVSRLALRMAEVRRLHVRPKAVHSAFSWPIEPVAVTSLFGDRIHPITGTFKPHQGLDLAAEFGQQVFASAAGTVIFAGPMGGHGNHVEVLHPGNVVTKYSHLSDILVDEGQLVKQGEAIGLAGSTGVSTGPHLHFEFWREGRPVDPLEELGDPALRPHEPVAAR